MFIVTELVENALAASCNQSTAVNISSMIIDINVIVIIIIFVIFIIIINIIISIIITIIVLSYLDHHQPKHKL